MTNTSCSCILIGFTGSSGVKNLPAMQETWIQSLSLKDPLEREVATHSIILAWEIPWTDEPGGYSPWGCKRIRHDLVTKHTHAYSYRQIHNKICVLIALTVTKWSSHFVTGNKVLAKL